ncbi:MAG: hypothetical protein WC472_03735 [Candidatus Paceibacterota bacterium]
MDYLEDDLFRKELWKKLQELIQRDAAYCFYRKFGILDILEIKADSIYGINFREGKVPDEILDLKNLIYQKLSVVKDNEEIFLAYILDISKELEVFYESASKPGRNHSSQNLM